MNIKKSLLGKQILYTEKMSTVLNAWGQQYNQLISRKSENFFSLALVGFNTAGNFIIMFCTMIKMTTWQDGKPASVWHDRTSIDWNSRQGDRTFKWNIK